jgi:hypothetical protein
VSAPLPPERSKVHIVRWVNLSTGASVIDSVWTDPDAAQARSLVLIKEKHTYAWPAPFVLDSTNKQPKENDDRE